MHGITLVWILSFVTAAALLTAVVVRRHRRRDSGEPDPAAVILPSLALIALVVPVLVVQAT